MTDLFTSTCDRCGIQNDGSAFRCLLCDERLDAPSQFDDKEKVLRFFAHGGISEIATAAVEGRVDFDSSDSRYQQFLLTAVKLGLESSWGSMDLIFYRDHPGTRSPFLGVRWPKNSIVRGIGLDFVHADKGTLTAILDRSSLTMRGNNFRFDDAFADSSYTYRLYLRAVVKTPILKERIIKSDPVVLEPSAPSAPFSIFRPISRTKVM